MPKPKAQTQEEEFPLLETRELSVVRPSVRGKFLYCGGTEYWVCGTTYGSFRPFQSLGEFHNPTVVKQDFALMASNNINAVRTYSIPPKWFLDLALQYDLRVMVGFPWEQHVTFLDSRKTKASIEARWKEKLQNCAAHPAIFCYAIGNEIPSSIVRWYGSRAIENFLKRLYETGKTIDPEGLFTYINYPSTEFLQLPFLDLVCFNVYLECPVAFDLYLDRLQNIAGDRPLLLTEIGLDSRRNGEEAQASLIHRQIRSAFQCGAAGAFVFSWTDEWYRGGQDIDDWDFGMTDRHRSPKPALASTCAAYSEVPFPDEVEWPSISVIVCTYNGSRTVRQTLTELGKLRYPNFEVIIIDDGSTDSTPSILSEFNFRTIRTENRGLSNARNTGMEAASGEILAYIDDDAYPDPYWLTYLGQTFLTTDHACVGGPNLAPPGDGPIAECVAHAPGTPQHVLLSDREAEHVPGCNFAFRKSALQAIGGFDPHFRIAGDDVDVCWRIQERGWSLGFSPASVVWHHRRNSIRAYCRQQMRYGEAESLLAAKWPEKYNSANHLTWKGRVYEKITSNGGLIYHGVWGNAPFQFLYHSTPGLIRSLPRMPEWILTVFVLAIFSALGLIWPPMTYALIPLLAALFCSVVDALRSACRIVSPPSKFSRISFILLTGLLYLIQPVARMFGRMMTLAAQRHSGFKFPWPQTISIWSERWLAPERRLQRIQEVLRAKKAVARNGGNFDRWDLEVRGGIFGACRLRMVVEEHGNGKQLARFSIFPVVPFLWKVFWAACLSIVILSAFDQALIVAVLVFFFVFFLSLAIVRACGSAMALLVSAVREWEERYQN